MTRQNSSIGASITVLSCGVEPPALLCSTSRRPNVSSVARIAAWRLASSVTSVRMAMAPLPARCAVSSPATAAMSATTTLAPSRANSTAVARPIPVAAPVMKATLPARRAMQFPPLELPQMLPQRGPGVLCAHHAALLEQGNDLLHERADVARPEPLSDGKAIAADRLDGVRQTIGDALGRPNERQ